MEQEEKDILNAAEEKNAAASSDISAAMTNSSEKAKRSKPLNKKFIAILVILVFLIIGYSAYQNGKFNDLIAKYTVGMSNKEAEVFLNNLLPKDTNATVSKVTKESGLYKIEAQIQGQDLTLYVTTDKKMLTVQNNMTNVADILADKAKSEAQDQADSQPVKNDKPVVELFVMSHCPFGTQIEKGMIPVVKTLGDKIDFKLKFCDFSMHNTADDGTADEHELKEELKQYCISQQQSDKLIPYLECFLGDEKSSDKCMAKVGIDTNKLNSCIASTDSQYNITSGFADKSTWKGNYPSFPVYANENTQYGISGSPSLVINGKLLKDPARDSASLLKTICDRFNNAPEECSKTLDSAAPSSGFGYAASSTGAASNASCGS